MFSLIAAVLGIAVAAVGIGVNAKINVDNRKAQEEVNNKQIELSERQYQRSTASNQKYELVKAGLSEQQARQNIAAGSGSGNYSTPTLTAPVQQPLDFNGMISSLGQFGTSLENFQNDAARPDGGFIGEMVSRDFIATINDHITEIPTDALRSPQDLRNWIDTNKPEWSQTDEFKKAMRQAYTQPAALRSVGFYCQNQAGYENVSNDIDNKYWDVQSKQINKRLLALQEKYAERRALLDLESSGLEVDKLKVELAKLESEKLQAFFAARFAEETYDKRLSYTLEDLVARTAQASLDKRMYQDPAYCSEWLAKQLEDVRCQKIFALYSTMLNEYKMTGAQLIDDTMPQDFQSLMYAWMDMGIDGDKAMNAVRIAQSSGVDIVSNASDMITTIFPGLKLNPVVVPIDEDVDLSPDEELDEYGHPKGSFAEWLLSGESDKVKLQRARRRWYRWIDYQYRHQPGSQQK